MAQITETRLVDDLDGEDAAETVTFSLDGVSYAIDLSEDNAAALRDALALYVGHARRVGGRRERGKSVAASLRSAAAGVDTSVVRAWAREKGLRVSDRGRIPGEIVAQYESEH